MNDEITIGARLRVLRRWRGQSLEQLAGLSGLSKSFLSMAERGQRTLDRRSHIAALAAALRVSETDLIGGPHLTADTDQAAPHAHVPALRVAVTTNGWHQDPLVENARPVHELATVMARRIEPFRRRYDYLTVGELLPGLIDELHHHAALPADEEAQQLALRTLVEAYMCAAGMARTLGYQDLGHMASVRADEAAVRLDDPIARGMAAFGLHRPNSDLRRVAAMASRAADQLEPHASVSAEGVQALGMLTLNAAMASAAVYDDVAARSWLAAADGLAARVQDDMDANWQAFSRTNVGIWRVSVAVEGGASGREVAELAAAVDESKLNGRQSRKACFLADVGRGLARDPGRRAEAIDWLARAERAAPQRFRNDVKARDTVAVLLERARIASQGRELRGMAARMGVPH